MLLKLSFNANVNLFSVAGLILDFLGVLLLFKFGLPSKIEIDQTLWDVGGTDEENSRRIAKKNQKIKFWAYAGLVFIALGFLLQLMSVVFRFD